MWNETGLLLRLWRLLNAVPWIVVSFALLAVHLDQADGGLCFPTSAILNCAHQACGCHESLRPILTDGGLAPYVISARTRVDDSAPNDAGAGGNFGLASVLSVGVGVKRFPHCTGASGIDGNGFDQEEEVIITFDSPVPAANVVFELGNYVPNGNSAVVFLHGSTVPSSVHVIPALELEKHSVFDPFGILAVDLGLFENLPDDLFISAVRIRAIHKLFVLREIGIRASCDDGDPCTLDSCESGPCMFVPAPAGTPCGDSEEGPCDLPDVCDGDGMCQPNWAPLGTSCGNPTNTDCTDPDSCDGMGNCSVADAPNGERCGDGLGCTTGEVCRDGFCGSTACVVFTGGCDNNLWSCAGNWDLLGTYPDNTPPVTYSVILHPGDDVILDVDVCIDALQVLHQAVLAITQIGLNGHLKIAQPTGLFLFGTIFMDNSQLLDVAAGSIFIGPGGLLGRSPVRSIVPGAADIVAGNMLLSRGTSCPPDCPPQEGGTIELSGTMSLTVNGNMVLNGIGATSCESTRFRGLIVPPPKFRAQDFSFTDVQGDFEILGAAAAAYSSSVPMNLGGDFNQQGTEPSCFEWEEGGLVLTSFGGGQVFEVGGRDVGPTQAGYLNNFAMGAIEVVPNGVVTFRNGFANQSTTAPCEEALYVGELILGAGARITLEGCRVYYRSLEDRGAMISTVGCGSLQLVPSCVVNGDCADGIVCTDDICGIGTGECVYTTISSLMFSDLDGSQFIDIDDLLCMLEAFAGRPTCPLERADLFPCGGNGAVDLDDLVAFLLAFNAEFACPNPCPP
ncbi:MAG: hypothetical protein AABZ47_16820 [Planctomycetota bacterium]